MLRDGIQKPSQGAVSMPVLFYLLALGTFRNRLLLNLYWETIRYIRFPYLADEEKEKARRAEVQRAQKDKERQEREATAQKQAVAPVQPETQAAPEPKEEPKEAPREEPAQEPQETGAFPMPEPQEDTQKTPQEAVQMELEDYPGVVPEKYITCHDGTQVIKPMESLRDEGCRLAEEVMQWMRTGTMEYARETQRKIVRLGEIIKEMLQDEECD